MIHLDRKPEHPVTVELGSAGQDLELQAIAHVMSIMRELGDDGKRRLLDYLCDRYPRIEVRSSDT